MIRIYFSCSLASSKNIYKSIELYDYLTGEISRITGAKFYLPYRKFHPNASEHSSAEVFAGDTSEILNCDLLMAFLDDPSHGVGAEVALSLERGKEVIGFSTVTVSRYLVGMLETYTNGYYIKSSSYEDAIPALSNYILSKIEVSQNKL